MINADGDNVDLYIPRKCSWTNRLITCKDHAAIQVNVGHLGPDGTYNGNYSTFAISGYVRNKVRFRRNWSCNYETPHLRDVRSGLFVDFPGREWLKTARFRDWFFQNQTNPTLSLFSVCSSEISTLYSPLSLLHSFQKSTGWIGLRHGPPLAKKEGQQLMHLCISLCLYF